MLTVRSGDEQRCIKAEESSEATCGRKPLRCITELLLSTLIAEERTRVKATRDLARRYEDKTNALIDKQSVPLGNDAPAGSQVTRPRPKKAG